MLALWFDQLGFILCNQLNLQFKAVAHNGYPSVRISLDGQVLADHLFTGEDWQFSISVGTDAGSHVLQVERYGKTEKNWSPEKDQILEIIGVIVDGIAVPNYVLTKHSHFEFNDQIHYGSLYFGPNGVWRFEFQTPILTFVLDQKIAHEAQYNQDYLYPWSYKLGPDSVNSIITTIDQTLERVKLL